MKNRNNRILVEIFTCLLIQNGEIIFELYFYIDVNIMVENYKTSILGIQA